MNQNNAERILGMFEDEGVLFLKSEDNIELSKGRKAEPLGMKKQWGGKDYIKTVTGWKPVGKESGKAKEVHDYVHGEKKESEEEKFEVGDVVEFTSRDNKKYEVNFRGYHNGGAIIVGKASDKIGQMGVDLNQLKKIKRVEQPKTESKVIGKTTSGKLIYDSHSHDEHKDFTWKEHSEASNLNANIVADILKKREKIKDPEKRDAMMDSATLYSRNEDEHWKKTVEGSNKVEKSNNINDFQKSQAARLLSCYNENDLEKSGEGSKGGKVIGHTKSGKPIYEGHHDSHNNFDIHDHFDAASEHSRQATSYSSGSKVSKQKENKAQHHRDMATHHRKEESKVQWKNDVAYYKNATLQEQAILDGKIAKFDDEEKKKFYLDEIAKK